MKRFAIIACLVALSFVGVQAAPPPPDAEKVYQKMIDSTMANDYDGFLSVCDATMKEALTKPQFDSVSKQLAPMFKGGYQSTYLGELSKRGYKVHLWRISFKAGGDDLMASLSIKDGVAGGFNIK